MSSTSILIFGLHSVEALLQNNPERVLHLHIQRERRDEKMEALTKLAQEKGVPFDLWARQELDRLAEDGHHQGIIAVCKKSRIYAENDLKHLLAELNTSPLILVLDGVQDPHNLGACFRSADAAGVHAIIVPKDKSVGLTPVVSKVASGAMETVPFVQVTNLVRAMEVLKTLGVWIFGAAAEATQTLYQTDLTGPVAIVLGAEGTGLRRLTREHCDGLIKIPMVGSVASLNVSVAAGICLFEAVRQRGNS